ncbi:nitroreductase family protein [Ascidiaceihabitans sp.]|nr:nitroreductase family protein [Ascidiaceihabitans sp.]MDA9136024.1 nitroreductase family protein [Ascidiaceihabitans sp.]
MKSTIRKYMPEIVLIIRRNIVETVSAITCYVYDFTRYMKSSSTFNSSSEARMLGKMVLYYHVIEKGLSFENRKPSFGLEVFGNLIDIVNVYIELGYNKNEIQFKTACSIIKKYFDVNNQPCEKLNRLRNKLDPEVFDYADPLLGGNQTVTKREVLESTNIDFKRFFTSRHSIREFAEEEVDIKKVLGALELARKYPSVCNRQAVRVYLITSKDNINEHLSYQNGNRGFGDKINKLIIVTADLNVFSRAEERNQPFIDGGIYLMGLLLALHSSGLGAVPLNWSTHKKSDRVYREFSNIKESEVIISFVGIGNLKNEMIVPKSERNNVKDILTVIE